MIALLLAVRLVFAAEETCPALEAPPESFQVAWVSKLSTTVGRNTPLQVIRVGDLRKLAETYSKDPTRVLQAIGLLSKTQAMTQEWKVTVFDVKRDQLCRPVDAPEGTTNAGMAVCPADWQRPGSGTRAKSWSSCGYLLDALTGQRSVDVYRVTWANASVRGFCVLPLTRFVTGG